MKLRIKAMLAVGSVFVALIVALGVFTNLSLIDSYLRLEADDVAQDLARAHDALHREKSTLDKVTRSKTSCGECHQFVLIQNSEFIEKERNDDTTHYAREANFALLVKSSGEVVESKRYLHAQYPSIPLPEDLLQMVRENQAFLNGLEQDSGGGIFVTKEGMLLVAVTPFNSSSERETSRDSLLVLAKYLTPGDIEHLSQITHQKVNLYSVDNPNNPPEIKDALAHLSPDVKNYVKPLSADSVAGFTLIEDILGAKSLLLRVEGGREIYRAGMMTIRLLVFYFLIVSLVVGGVIVFTIDRLVLLRLAGLSSQVNKIADRSDFGARVLVQGNDEISILTTNINGMLASLEKSDTDLQQYSQSLEMRTRELKNSQNKLLSLFASSPDAITVVDPETHILDCNLAALQVFGCGNKEVVIGRSVFDFVQRHDHDRAVMDLEKVKNGKVLSNLSYTLLKQDGTSFPAELAASFIHDPHSQFDCYIIISRDVTEREEAQKALSRTEHRYRLLFERSVTGVFCTTLEGRFIDCNEAYARLLGCSSRQEIIGARVEEFFMNPPDRNAFIDLLRRQGSVVDYELHLKRLDGASVWVLENATLVMEEGEEPLTIQGTVIDVTERKINQEHEKEMQVELVQQARLAGIGMLAAGIAHNINTPLQGIITHIELLKLTRPDLPYMDDIIEQAMRISFIVNNMLHKSRQEQSQQEQDIDLNKLLIEELEFLNADLTFKHEINKTYDFDPDLPLIRGIYSDFSQSLVNVIRNSIDAMHDRPKKWLSVRTSRCPNDEIMVEVKDIGCGISPEIRRSIFEPFFTTKPMAGRQQGREPAGTGLGLSSTHQLMGKYKARFDIQSEVGKGTAFRIYLPCERTCSAQPLTLVEIIQEVEEAVLV